MQARKNHLGNRDNLVIGGDISARPRPGLEVYAAWFLDDMVKFDPSAFANQFALQLGAFWVDPPGLRDTDLRAEYARVEPFVYAPNFDINTYEHHECPVGLSHRAKCGPLVWASHPSVFPIAARIPRV